MLEAQNTRGRRRVMVGVVTSDKRSKTRTVVIPRLVKHPKYGKYIRRSTTCHVHDENNESHIGDTVEIVGFRPFSMPKFWLLASIVIKGLSAFPSVKDIAQPV